MRLTRGGFIYIMCNQRKTVLYIGVTSDLAKRVGEYKAHVYLDSFTAKYNVEWLLYYEISRQ